MSTCPRCRLDRLLLIAVAVFLLGFMASAVVTFIAYQAGFEAGAAFASALDTYTP
ncbi:MAG: hypothetical protein OXI26_01045 [bacterium]|nr:hypothetical protein [bacterium]